MKKLKLKFKWLESRHCCYSRLYVPLPPHHPVPSKREVYLFPDSVIELGLCWRLGEEGKGRKGVRGKMGRKKGALRVDKATIGS